MATTGIAVEDQDLEKLISPETVAAGALVLQQSHAITKIEDDATYQRVCAMGIDAAANIKNIEAILDPICDERYAHWKRATAVRSAKVTPFLTVKDRAGHLTSAYQTEQERRAREEEARLRAKQEEDDQKRRALEAEQLAKEGRVEEGVAVLESREIMPSPIVSAATTPKVQGVSAARKKYTVRIVDKMKLIKAVAEGKVPHLAVIPDEQFLNKQATALKELLDYPGVVVEVDSKSAFRAPK